MRKRTKLPRNKYTPAQTHQLENYFLESRKLDANRKREIAEKTGLERRQVKNWFQSRSVLFFSPLMSRLAEDLSYTRSWYREKKIQRRLASDDQGVGLPSEAPEIGPSEPGSPPPDTLASTSRAGPHGNLGTEGGGDTTNSSVSVLSVPIREPLTHVV